MLIIGDVHGKVDQYHQIIKREKAEKSVQLGDFGFQRQHDWFLENMDCAAHKVLFGNHDYYPYLHKPHSMCGTCAYNRDEDIFFVRGAYSIDHKLRLIGRDLFEDEEIPYSQFDQVLHFYEQIRPTTVVTHDCPHAILSPFFAYSHFHFNRTGQLLDALFYSHKPKTWIFGHHHISRKMDIYGTEFICLNELESIYI